jgi:hypothetical protein
MALIIPRSTDRVPAADNARIAAEEDVELDTKVGSALFVSGNLGLGTVRPGPVLPRESKAI